MSGVRPKIRHEIFVYDMLKHERRNGLVRFRRKYEMVCPLAVNFVFDDNCVERFHEFI